MRVHYYYGSVGEVTEKTIQEYIDNQGEEEENIKIFE
jgi:REP element-mobilizing transposase RayT